MTSFVLPIVFLVTVFSASYYGVRLILGPTPEMPDCNMGIQSFDLKGRSIYWQVQEGPCRYIDPNFGDVRANAENLLVDIPIEQWPEAECAYAQLEKIGFVFKYGTDYYDVEELDCLEPLRELQAEKEANYDWRQWVKDNVPKKPSMNANQLINLFFN